MILGAREHGQSLANRVHIDRDSKMGAGGGPGADALDDYANQFWSRAAADDENRSAAVAGKLFEITQE